ncbi:TRAP transporter small permease [Halomonas heilongjiangensis]|uniref:TRAP transporter small permease protein n=1 Tax=Halomonas heilongjiangensis TaxID=1387883 RepID=A0A2N7TLS6_9GAMM|nr:TRAP transporter small permease subunit [Halomonas heilongjiangensis]PMR69145.1 C4-dicarboxylate ABC transporter permease [Halomonas heilongjiangensis]PXX94171.1 C4-dicarboxylate ABC transporter permease [Halomonas heilongjiangensis]
MSLLLHGLARLNRVLERLLHLLLLALLFGFILLIVYQVASRNLPLLPRLYWTEEFSRFAFQWMIMLGTAVGVLHADHFVLEAFPRGSRADLATRLIRDLACLAVGVIFIVYGRDFALSGLRRSATASGLSMVYVYSTFLISGAFILLFSVQRLLHTALHGMTAMEAALNTPDEVVEALEHAVHQGDPLATPSTQPGGRP